MNANHGAVRSLEQQESGEMRSLRCARCGARGFRSIEQLARHENACAGQGNQPARRPGGDF